MDKHNQILSLSFFSLSKWICMCQCAIFLSASALIFKRNILQEPQQQHKHSLFYYYPFCLCSAAARHDLYRVKIYITTCPYTKKKGKEKQKQRKAIIDLFLSQTLRHLIGVVVFFCVQTPPESHKRTTP